MLSFIKTLWPFNKKYEVQDDTDKIEGASKEIEEVNEIKPDFFTHPDEQWRLWWHEVLKLEREATDAQSSIIDQILAGRKFDYYDIKRLDEFAYKGEQLLSHYRFGHWYRRQDDTTLGNTDFVRYFYNSDIPRECQFPEFVRPLIDKLESFVPPIVQTNKLVAGLLTINPGSCKLYKFRLSRKAINPRNVNNPNWTISAVKQRKVESVS